MLDTNPINLKGFVDGPSFSANYSTYSEGLFIDAAAFLEEGDIAIDAGCFIGENAFAFAYTVGRSGKVYTFEPDPRLHEMVVARLRANEDGTSSILLSDCALGDADGTVEFYIKNEVMGHSGLVRNIDADLPNVTFSTVQRQVVKLDTYLSSKREDLSRVKAIKFDLEGAELRALSGARGTIGAGRPIIMFEYGRLENYGVKPHDYFDFFSSINYQIVTCYDTDVPSSRDLIGNIGWNLFALPRSNPYLRGRLSRLINSKLPWLLEREQPIV